MRPPSRGRHTRRRKFIALLAAATAWPLTARAQQADRVRRIGVLIGYTEDDPETKARLAAFRQRLEKRGSTEGGNVHIETRFAGSDSSNLTIPPGLLVAADEVIE